MVTYVSSLGRSGADPFRTNRVELGRALLDAIHKTIPPGWPGPRTFEALEEWGRAQLLTAVDLFCEWQKTGAPWFAELFMGWVSSRLAADLSSAGVPPGFRPHEALRAACERWTDILRPTCPADILERMRRDLDHVITALACDPVRELNVLFIGDCLQLEIIAALVGPCTQSRIRVTPTIVVEKVQPLLRNRLRTFAPDQFHLVFFSPFSHTYLPEYAALQDAKTALWSRSRIRRQAEGILADVRATLDALRAHFQGRIYVHNTAGTVQSFGWLSGLGKHVASWRARSTARTVINDGLAEYLSDDREARVLLLDEDGLRSNASAYALGQVAFSSHAFHPTRLGVGLGRGPYFDAVCANAFLAGKKVVVCDLDNTLWDGVIGEGAVRHFLDRQDLLKQLKERGVLLSINSKNDPKNVHWAGARVQADDFVAPQINWEPKTVNIERIGKALNLKLKDFVFVDDRPDELERVTRSFPEIVTLNATEPATWRFVAAWQRLLPANPGEDRTKLYHENSRRTQFVKDLAADGARVEDEAAALRALEITVTLRSAGQSDITRAVELVNRTNQFNLCGSRTSVRELQDGLGTKRDVVIALARDKFGSMGMVGVMVIHRRDEGVEIPIFVLSCRVFGYGIEYALLNALKGMPVAGDRVAGHYKETSLNEPCRKLYAASGLQWDGDCWVGEISALPPDPAWLHIENQLAGRALAAEVGSV
jgi:FkbH-like protein